MVNFCSAFLTNIYTRRCNSNSLRIARNKYKRYDSIIQKKMTEQLYRPRFLGFAKADAIAMALMLFLIVLIGMPRDASSLITTAVAPVSVPGAMTTTALRAASTAIPSWEDLAAATQCDRHELPIAADGRSFSSDPNLSDGTRPTLYRERHGWCPYSERVWLAIEAKGIEYDTIYIDNIYGRPR